MARVGMQNRGSTSPVSNLSSADSFNLSNEERNLHGSEQHEAVSQGAVLDSLNFEKIEEYNRLKETKAKKLQIQAGLSKETHNQIKMSQQATARQKHEQQRLAEIFRKPSEERADEELDEIAEIVKDIKFFKDRKNLQFSHLRELAELFQF